MARFKATRDQYFPNRGEAVHLFFSGELSKHNFDSMNQTLSRINDEASSLILNVNSWFVEFQAYFSQTLGYKGGLVGTHATIEEIHSALVRFLFSPSGGRYQYLFTFDHDLKCGKALPTVYVTIMELTHRHFNTSNEGIEAMNTIKDLMRSSSFQGRNFPFAPMYSVWVSVLQNVLHGWCFVHKLVFCSFAGD